MAKAKKVLSKGTKRKGGSKGGSNKKITVGKWNKHKFILSSKKVLGFDDLKVKSSSELKDKKKSKQGQVARKGANPTEVSLTVYLNAYAGCNVRKEAKKFLDDAHDGKKDYFYVGKKKLLSCKLMLTEASLQEVMIARNGTWTSAQLQLTFKQCDKGSGSDDSDESGSSDSSGGGGSSGGSSGGGGGGGSNKVSVNNSSPVANDMTIDAVSSAQPQSTSEKVSGALGVIRNTVQEAKAYSAATKGTVNNFQLNRLQ